VIIASNIGRIGKMADEGDLRQIIFGIILRRFKIGLGKAVHSAR
jgi:hypothetical protein